MVTCASNPPSWITEAKSNTLIHDFAYFWINELVSLGNLDSNSQSLDVAMSGHSPVW